MKNKLVAVLTVGLLAGPTASATVIQFEGLVSPGAEIMFLNPYSESGFDFASNAGDFRVISATLAYSGLTSPTGDYGFVQNSDYVITISRATPFSLQSFDAGLLFFRGNGRIDVIGNLAAGGTVASSFAVLDVVNSAGSLQGFSFDSTWIGLSSVSIIRTLGNFLAIDNITLDDSTSVPEPGTLALLGLGLAGLGFARRRKLN